MDEKFDAFLKAYETMGDQAKGAADIMIKGMMLGLFSSGVLLGSIIAQTSVSIWEHVKQKKAKKRA